MAELKVDREALERASRGVRTLVEDFGDVRLDEIGLGASSVGQADVAAALHDFCDAWRHGLHALVADAQLLAAALDLGVGRVEEADAYAGNVFKELFVSLWGDPTLSSAEIEERSLADHWRDLYTHGYTHEAWHDLAAHARDTLDWAFDDPTPPWLVPVRVLDAVRDVLED